MISALYRHYGKHLLWCVVLTLPVLWHQARTIPSNNDIETWLPRNTAVREVYEQFKKDFGVEEAIVLGIERSRVDDPLIEALAGRLEQIPGVGTCWTPARVIERMTSIGVPADEAERRLVGLMLSDDRDYIGMLVPLTEHGLTHRGEVVGEIRDALAYCQLTNGEVALTGAPVIVSELDRLGSRTANQRFFMLTVLVCLGLVQYSVGHWRMSLAVLGITLWGIYLTQAVVALCGGQMNFIMGALSVMVMIFTLSIAIHFLSYYSSALKDGMADPLGYAVRESWNPCFLSTLTTLIGLISLNVSSILPVSQFSYAAGLGSVVGLVVGLGITPALVVLWPHCTIRESRRNLDFAAWGGFVARHSRLALGIASVVLVVTGVGIWRLESRINAVDFLPRRNAVLTDLRRVESELTNVDSIEAVVTFSDEGIPFAERLRQVRELEATIRRHPSVRHVFSLAAFFPEEMPDSPLAVMRMFDKALSYGDGSGYTAQEQRLWRVSARINPYLGRSPAEIFTDLEAATAGAPIHFTGVTPLLENAQQEIFTGFWKSFTGALLSISLVMILSLRSIVGGLIAMVPNIMPIWFVFGAVGLWGLPIDIGMMMTGSIALGISVDCTFHFLVKYQEHYRTGATSVEACQEALSHTGTPLLDSTVVCSLGMLALCLSPFAPTARFGYFMAGQMVASLLGELVLLPALLSIRPERRNKPQSDPPADSRGHSTTVRPPHFTSTGNVSSRSSRRMD